MIGLGLMGQNVAKNLLEHGFELICYSVRKEERETFSSGMAGSEKILFPETIAELVNHFKEGCKRILLLVKAGEPIDVMLDSLLPLLNKEDILIDLGNSFYRDSQKRALKAEAEGIYFLDTGISGGKKGARYGASLMAGGNHEAFQACEDIFEALSARFQSRPCYHYIGPSGTGHFVKMVHNGIEYALMQIIAEYYFLLKEIFNLHSEEIYSLFGDFKGGINQSYLLEITTKILNVYGSESGELVLEKISDQASQKGTGKWASIIALELSSPASLIILSTQERDLSSSAIRRRSPSCFSEGRKENNPKIEQWLPKIEQALFVCSLAAYAQGFDLIQKASELYRWNIKLAPIAATWRAGCIIQSFLLVQIEQGFSQNPWQSSLLSFAQWDLSEKLRDLRDVVKLIIDNSAPLPLICNVLQYLSSLSCSRLPTNLIQAQRDFFGGHGFDRDDEPGHFHQQWEAE